MTTHWKERALVRGTLKQLGHDPDELISDAGHTVEDGILKDVLRDFPPEPAQGDVLPWDVCFLQTERAAGDTVAVQDGLIRLANDLRIDPWVRREIIELLEPVKNWHHPVGLTMKNAPAGDTVAVPREMMHWWLRISSNSYPEFAAEISRLLDGRQP